MKRLRPIYPLMLSLILLLGSCGGTRQQRNMLSRAERLLNSHPDSSLKILDSARNEVPNFPRSLRMKYELLFAAAQNKNFVNFTSDSVMKEVTAYYDAHGTANEQMQAHYLLGCVYRDQNDAPRALQCYHDAVEKADTTCTDCDYYTLCSIHSQMYSLFDDQGYDEQSLAEISKMQKCALLGKDTIGAINAYEYRSNIYFVNNQLDSAYNISMHASRLYAKYGYIRESALALNNAINSSVLKGNYVQAKKLIDIYESKSGRLDNNHNVMHGCELYYYIKGLYYYGIHQLDSAEYFFRKEMRDGKDIKDQKCSSRGLFLVYSRRKDADSITKYSQMCYGATDSFQQRLSADNLRQVRALYDYSHSQQVANDKTREASEFRFWLTVSSAAVVVLLLTFLLVYRRKQQRISEMDHEHEVNLLQLRNREAELADIQQSNRESKASITKMKLEISHLRTAISDSDIQNQSIQSILADKESELTGMREKVKSNDAVIEVKKMEIDELNQKISKLQDDSKEPATWNLDSEFQHAPIVMTLHKYGAKGVAASEEEFAEFVNLMRSYSKGFMEALEIDRNGINETELRICLLIRLRFVPLEISNIMDLTRQHVANIRTRLLLKIFKKQGRSKDFDYQIRKL